MVTRNIHVVLTAGVVDWIAGSETRLAWISHCLARHDTCDWGDLDTDDRRANDHAARTRDGRLLSNYPIPAWLAADTDDTALWIITDDLAHPDTATTILFPSDY